MIYRKPHYSIYSRKTIGFSGFRVNPGTPSGPGGNALRLSGANGSNSYQINRSILEPLV